MRKYKFGYSKGFTLVELLVVIAIIGVLSTLLLLQLNIARAKARDAKRVADINQVRSALELYYDDAGTYPNSADFVATVDLSTYISKTPVEPARANCTGVYSGPALNAGGCYGYAYQGTTRFHLWAELETGAASALKNDLDADTTAAGDNWAATAPTGGAYVDGTLEPAGNTACNTTGIDCVYDTGQTQ